MRPSSTPCSKITNYEISPIANFSRQRGQVGCKLFLNLGESFIVKIIKFFPFPTKMRNYLVVTIFVLLLGILSRALLLRTQVSHD